MTLALVPVRCCQLRTDFSRSFSFSVRPLLRYLYSSHLILQSSPFVCLLSLERIAAVYADQRNACLPACIPAYLAAPYSEFGEHKWFVSEHNLPMYVSHDDEQSSTT